MSAPLTSLPATELAASVREGTRRAAEVVEAFLVRIAAVDPALHAFLEVHADEARRSAAAIDKARACGAALGPLAGVPFALKDNLTRQGHLATCASRILQGFRSPYSATAVTRLERAGAICIGRTNMDEFGFGSSTEHSCYGPTRNPFDLTKTPGGSSGGSAVAVAARLCPLALGSDTGGSVRQPAALCGVPGLKPTYGRISRHGLIAFASTLDCVGIFGRTVGDLALALSVLAGCDPSDSTSLDAVVPDYTLGLQGNLAGLRIGVSSTWRQGLDGEVEAATATALGQLEALGARLVPVELPTAEHATSAYYLIANAEASSNLARYDGVRYGLRAADHGDLDSMYAATRGAGFGAEAKLRILLGTFCLCSGYYDAWYGKATRVRTLIRAAFSQAFGRCDVLVGPTSPLPAFALGERLTDPLQMYLCDVLTVPASLAGIPALSVPCGFTAAGLPIGLQIQGPVLGESHVLRVAHAYQQSQDFAARQPMP